MSTVTIPEQAVLTKRYPAIDGISKPPEPERQGQGGSRYPARPATRPIRSDVQSIIEMNDDEFDVWYTKRRNALLVLTDLFFAAGDVPHLSYDSEEQRSTFGSALTSLQGVSRELREAREHLEVIKAVREQS